MFTIREKRNLEAPKVIHSQCDLYCKRTPFQKLGWRESRCKAWNMRRKERAQHHHGSWNWSHLQGVQSCQHEPRCFISTSQSFFKKKTDQGGNQASGWRGAVRTVGSRGKDGQIRLDGTVAAATGRTDWRSQESVWLERRLIIDAASVEIERDGKVWWEYRHIFTSGQHRGNAIAECTEWTGECGCRKDEGTERAASQKWYASGSKKSWKLPWSNHRFQQQLVKIFIDRLCDPRWSPSWKWERFRNVGAHWASKS